MSANIGWLSGPAGWIMLALAIRFFIMEFLDSANRWKTSGGKGGFEGFLQGTFGKPPDLGGRFPKGDNESEGENNSN